MKTKLKQVMVAALMALLGAFGANAADPDKELQGKVPGVEITSESGQPGASPSIRIRGSRSLSGSSDPLIIIDGVKGDLNDISPSDIESMEVLKDAAATALYGAQGANGVVLITTGNPLASTAPLYVIDGIVMGGVLPDIPPSDIMSIDVLKDASAAAIYGSRGANGVVIITTKRGAAVSEKDRLAAISSGIGACASNMFQRIQSAPGRADFFADCHALAVKAIYERPGTFPESCLSTARW